MRSPRFWAFLYLFMGSGFIYFAIQQKSRSGVWDWFTIALIAIAAYDFMIAIKYFTFKPKEESKK